jgi:magnesium-transporting ATPase (P-type)
MGWRTLWLLIWFLVPIAGPIIAIVKFYSYRFVPYIMLADPDIQATEALKKSMLQTYGYKGKMFLADFLLGLAVAVVSFLFGLLLSLGPIGIFLAAIYFILLYALLPLIMGTLEAVYYDKISKEKPIN